MRDAARNVGPCGPTLIGQLVCDVVEGDDRTLLITHTFYRKSALAVLRGNDHVGLALLAVHEFVELAGHLRERNAFKRFLLVLKRLSAERLMSRILLLASSATTPAVTLDRTASVKAPRVSSCAFADMSADVCSSSRPVMRLNALAKSLNLVLGLRDRDPRGEVTFLNASGGGHQLRNRSHQSIRELQRSDNRQAYDKQ